jgi:hypothetical protein
METHLDLPAPLFELLRVQADTRGISLEQAAIEAIGEGVRQTQTPAEAATTAPFKQRAQSMGLPLIDLNKALSIANEIDDFEMTKKMRLFQE